MAFITYSVYSILRDFKNQRFDCQKFKDPKVPRSNF